MFHDGQQIYAGQLMPFEPKNRREPKKLVAGGRMVPGNHVLQKANMTEDPKQTVVTQFQTFEVKGQ